MPRVPLGLNKPQAPSRRELLLGRILDRVLGLDPGRVIYEVHRNLETTMADGAMLLGDLYRPIGVDGPLPTVLIRLPYGRAGLIEQITTRPLARHGFQVFIQSTRGTFGSGGGLRLFTSEEQDGVTTLSWVRQQPWSDGHVSMSGDSYYGHTQWAVAPYVDEPLESVTLNLTAAQIASAFYDHGAPCLETALYYSGVLARQESAGTLDALLPHPRRTARLRSVLKQLPLQDADRALTGVPVSFWQDFVDHAEPDDPYWAVSDHSGADYSRMPPTNMVSGWWDLFVKSQLEDFQRLQAAGVPARLLVGPWLHASPGRLRHSAPRDIEWLAHHLQGGPAPNDANVRVYLQRADTWLDFETWPPLNIEPLIFYIRADGSLSRSGPQSGSPTDDTDTPSRYTYDPADPTPTVGGPKFSPPGMQMDNRKIEARPDVATFTSEPLPVDVDIVGNATARVFVRTSTPHADVFVRVCDVDAKGRSYNVIDGIRRLDPRTVPAHDVDDLGTGILAVDVELTPTAYRFVAGRRIRVQISSGAFPRYARNLGTGAPLGVGSDMQSCDVEIFHGARYPTQIELSALAPRRI